MGLNRIDEQMTTEDDAFVERASRMLRESAENLDAGTRSKLDKARQRALFEMRERSGVQRWLADQWVPVCGAVLVALAVTGLWLGSVVDTGGEAGFQQAAVATMDPGELADLDMLLADENLEMIEDLEFFSWLDSEFTPEELEAELEAAG